MNDPFEGFPYTPPSKNLQRGDLVRIINYKKEDLNGSDLAVIVHKHMKSTLGLYKLFDGKETVT
jgi:hypothetical protein